MPCIRFGSGSIFFSSHFSKYFSEWLLSKHFKKVVEGIIKGFEIKSGEKITISNTNINLHDIIKYKENLPALSLNTWGNLITGNYNIKIYVKKSSGFFQTSANYFSFNNFINKNEHILDGTILGYYSLDSLYKNPE